MIRKILLVFSFSFYTFALYGQTDTGKMIYFKTLPRLEVVNEQIYQLLDSLILYNENCIYAIHGKSYYFDIKLYKKENDTIDISLGSWQCNEAWFKDRTNKMEGFFYYKGILVVVKPSNIFSLFFKKTSDMQDIYYKKHILYIHCGFMEIEYHYINDVFTPGYKALCLCQGSSPYYHKIKEGETWEKITEDYGITIEDLISLNKRIKIKKPPIKVKSVRVY